MKKFIYHYHLSYQLTSSGSVIHVDGIAALKHKIVNMDDYREFKKLAEPSHYDIATVRSLTLIDGE